VSLYVNRKTACGTSTPVAMRCATRARCFDDLYRDEPERKPTARIVELPDPTDAVEAEAIEAFTRPCVLCVPGARELSQALPFEFEDPDEYEPYGE
jgi:hypothetical protein